MRKTPKTHLFPTNNVPFFRVGITKSNVTGVEISVAVPVSVVRVRVTVVSWYYDGPSYA